MRRAFGTGFGLLLIFVACGTQSEEELYQQLSDLYEQEDFAKALAVADRIIEDFGPTRKAVNNKYKILLALEDYEGALETFEIILEQVGESPDVAIDKVRLLGRLGRNEEALEYALTVDEKSSEKSAYLSSYICKLYVGEGEKESALYWMAASLERGDDGFEYYLGDDFTLLHGEPRFSNIIEEMKQATGIGMPAKDFTAPLLSGDTYTLSENRGEVVLIDFWATWCPPCVAELPRLGELYEELNPEGFEIIGISLDSDEQQLKEFLARRDLAWGTIFSGKGMDDEVAKLYRVDSAPRYWVVDQEGIVQHSFEMGGTRLETAIREVVGNQ